MNSLANHPSLVMPVIIALILGVIACFRMKRSVFWTWIGLGSNLFLGIANIKMGDPLWGCLWLGLVAFDILYIMYVHPNRLAMEAKDAPEV